MENKKSSSNIYRSILKFGYKNFSFSIIEFCNIEDLNTREVHFINELKPQYNIRKPSINNKNKDS